MEHSIHIHVLENNVDPHKIGAFDVFFYNLKKKNANQSIFNSVYTFLLTLPFWEQVLQTNKEYKFRLTDFLAIVFFLLLLFKLMPSLS